jgi:hypothetical protein
MRGAVLPFVFALACAPPSIATAKDTGPVVVELFTAQGCAYCPQANRLFAELADRKGVLALTFPVDYWDYLGWKDTFAKPEFSARQRLYMKAAGQREVYTPQVVVDGLAQTDRGSAEGAPALVAAAARRQAPAPAMTIRGARLQVGSGRLPVGGADVWMVRYQAQPRETPVKDGENRGVTVVYRNVATGLVKLGAWSGRPKAYVLPKPGRESEGKTAILLQARGSGRILGVLRP